jgi:hypothetical protein
MSDGLYKIMIDEVNANLTYIGKAEPGTPLSSSLWQIITITPTGVLSADGTDEFIKIWNDRASYSYS